jgi:transposase
MRALTCRQWRKPVTPFVTRHREFACRCAGCGIMCAPPQTDAGTPLSRNVHAMALYLKGFQALSYQRPQGLFAGLFGLVISQGALMNMFKRSAGPFAAKAGLAKALLRQADIVASDETGVRIEGANSYHWVFRCDKAVVHTPEFSRAASVVHAMMDGHRPQVWISDRCSAQQNHAVRHQTCLAHLARNIAFAHEHGTDRLPSRLLLWFGKVFGLARDITKFARSAIIAGRKALEKALDGILAAASSCELAKALQAKIARARS